MRAQGLGLLVVAALGAVPRDAGPGQAPAGGGTPATASAEAKEGGQALGEEARRRRITAAVRTIRQALRDLPPGADAARIRKALDRIQERLVEEIKGGIAVGQAGIPEREPRALGLTGPVPEPLDRVGVARPAARRPQADGVQVDPRGERQPREE